VVPEETLTNDKNDDQWWRTAVIYQIYPRSFADGNGDGIGDLAGIRAHLHHLAELGVDALWLSPWYPSPMKDAGYDVADYRGVAEIFGSVEEAEALLAEASVLGIRVIIDIVPNHTSDQHPWFQEALRSRPGTKARERYHFVPGRGPDGAQPPNNWESVFGGSAWTRVEDADGQPGEWYLHLFAPEQPDLNWHHLDVREDFAQTLRFWFDRGVAGFRIDVAHGLMKAPGYPDLLDGVEPGPDHPHWDRDEVHDIYRQWRAIADDYSDRRVFVAEAWVASVDRLARYVRSDELHTAFNFDYLTAPWSPPWLRRTIDETLRSHSEVGAPPTWVLSNHDVVREVSRYARSRQDRAARDIEEFGDSAVDIELGRRRARAATMLMLALPGSAYIYQGAELGLAEVEDLPESALRDPIFAQSGGTRRGRDGCRVPIPWSGSTSPFGFSPSTASAPPWLPMPKEWADFSVEAQTGDPGSMLELVRHALRIRRATFGVSQNTNCIEELAWVEVSDTTLCFTRKLQAGREFACVVNFGPDALQCPVEGSLLLGSGPLASDGRLPSQTTAWFISSMS